MFGNNDNLIIKAICYIGKSVSTKIPEFFQNNRQKLYVKKKGAEQYMQDYGFYSILSEEGEAISVYPQGVNNGVVIKADMPKFRPSGGDVQAGEVGLFNSDGVRVRLVGKEVIIEGTTDIRIGNSPAKSVLTESLLEYLLNHTHTFAGPSGETSPSTVLKTLVKSELVTNTKVE